MKIAPSFPSLLRASAANHANRGSTLLVVLWSVTILTGLALALGHSARVEALASANRLAIAQADAAERGAEQFVLSAVDMEVASPGALDANNVFSDDPNDPIVIGNPPDACPIWIIKPDQFDETAISFGLTDEASKLDINKCASSPAIMNTMLINLPNITQENVDCILDWENPPATPRPEGAEDDYYMGLSPAYHCKNAPFETVEELNLVKSIVTDDTGNPTDLLFGEDHARSGHVDQTTSMMPATITLGQSTSNRGIFPFITVYGVQASTTPPASASSSLGSSVLGATGASTTRAANVNDPNSNLRTVLTNALGGGRANSIILAMTARARAPTGGRGGTTPGAVGASATSYATTLQWAATVGLTSAEYSKIIHQVTATAPATAGGAPGAASASTSKTTTAKINVNTASEQVLMCLPGFEQADADAIIAYLQANPNPDDPTDISWLLDVVSRPKLIAAAAYLAGASSCFSADILAASPDGRAFKRVRIVVDASSGTSQIIYRRDLTQYGWPLDPQTRANLRSGNNTSITSPFAGGLR